MCSGLGDVGQAEKANPFCSLSMKSNFHPLFRGWVQCYQLVGTGAVLEAKHSFLLLEDRVTIGLQNSFEEGKFLWSNMYLTSCPATMGNLFMGVLNKPLSSYRVSWLRDSFDKFSLKVICCFAVAVFGWQFIRDTNILKFWANSRKYILISLLDAFIQQIFSWECMMC